MTRAIGLFAAAIAVAATSAYADETPSSYRNFVEKAPTWGIVVPLTETARTAPQTASVDFPHQTPGVESDWRFAAPAKAIASVDFPHQIPSSASAVIIASDGSYAIDVASVDFPHTIAARVANRISTLSERIGDVVARDGFTASGKASLLSFEVSLLTDPTVFAIDIETASIPTAPEVNAINLGAEYGHAYYGEFFTGGFGVETPDIVAP